MNVFKRIYENLKTYGLKKTIINKTRIYLNFFFLLVSSKKKFIFQIKRNLRKYLSIHQIIIVICVTKV
ncbi:MAG: hypothetical protein CBB97_06530 [Candidatus Endolissoclinum sp. TMED37]|nr:MAG: hypothetical protein CBB97_06530 [Candidatus Endolissoclinum sp. TMED37]